MPGALAHSPWQACASVEPWLGSEQVHGQKEAALARVKAVEKQKQDMAARNEELRRVLLLPLLVFRYDIMQARWVLQIAPAAAHVSSDLTQDEVPYSPDDVHGPTQLHCL